MNPGEHAQDYQTKDQLRSRITELEREVDRLTLEHGKVCDSRREWMENCITARQEIDRLKGKRK